MLRTRLFFCLFYLSSSLEQALGWLASKFLWNNQVLLLNFQISGIKKSSSRIVSVQSNGLAHVYYQDMATEPFCYDLGFFLNDCHIK